MGRSRTLAVLAAVLATALCGAARAASVEASVKAAYLFNFARFVEWPTTAFAGPATDLVIGVAGDCDVRQALEELVRSELVNGRHLVVKSVTGAAAGCHILFVCRATADRERALVASSKRAGILLVGESEQFLSVGGTIRFYMAENKVKFEVSQANAVAAGLKLSSRLLKVARVADAGKGRP